MSTKVRKKPSGASYCKYFKTMLPKIILRRVLMSMLLVGIVEGFFLYGYLNQKELIREVSSEITHAEAAGPMLPVRLRIPRIDLDSEIEYVGLTQSGEMATPGNISNVGWYEQGVRPGELGNAVIAGHSGWENQKVSAFDELHTLQIGDKIYVEDSAGIIITFVVREKRDYDAEDDVPEVFNITDKKSHLNLITCVGDWSPLSQSYSKRLVVFADRK